MWTPTFEDALQAMVGDVHNVSFSTVALNLYEVIGAMEYNYPAVDFLFIDPSTAVCTAIQYDSRFVATVRVLAPGGVELSEVGGVVFAKAGNDAVANISDIANQRTSWVLHETASSFSQFQLMRDAGLNQLTDPSIAIVGLSDLSVVTDVLLTDDADVGFVTSGSLELATAYGMISASDYKIIHQVDVSAEVPGYPYAVSTQLTPQWPLVALAHVPVDLVNLVAAALMSINATDSAAVAGSYSTWDSPAPNTDVYALIEDAYFAVDQSSCVLFSSTGLYDAILCPDGTQKLTEYAVYSNCATVGLTCPENRYCVCQPCRAVADQRFSVDLNGVVCNGLAICGERQQRETFSVHVADKWYASLNDIGATELTTLELHVTHGGVQECFLPPDTLFPCAWSVLSETGGDATQLAAAFAAAATLFGDGEYFFNVSVHDVGEAIAAVIIDGEVTENGIVVLKVTERDCSYSLGLVATDDGDCVCGGNYRDQLDGRDCVRTLSTNEIIGISMSAIALVIMTGFGFVAYRRRLADKLWRVPASAVVWPDPPHVLGRGNYGLVLAANYRGIVVAVKQMASNENDAVTGSGSSNANEFGGTRSKKHTLNREHANGGFQPRPQKAANDPLSPALAAAAVVREYQGVRKQKIIRAAVATATAVEADTAAGKDVMPTASGGWLALRGWLIASAAQRRRSSGAGGSGKHGSGGGANRSHDAFHAAGPVTPATPPADSPRLFSVRAFADASKAASPGPRLKALASPIMSHSRGPSMAVHLPADDPEAVVPAFGGGGDDCSTNNDDWGSGSSGDGGGCSTVGPGTTAAAAATAVAAADATLDAVHEAGSVRDRQSSHGNSSGGQRETRMSGATGERGGGGRGGTHSLFTGSVRSPRAMSTRGVSRLLWRCAPWGRERDYEVLHAEIRILTQLRHPNITTVMGGIIVTGSPPRMVMELMERGSLFDILHNASVSVETALAVEMLRDVSCGMVFLHESGIIHNDMKSQNILIDRSFKAKVADFGLASITSRRRGASSSRAAHVVGTPFWMAPEVLRGLTATPASDVYSFGIVIHECTTRKEPYHDHLDPYMVLRKVADESLKDPDVFRPTVSANVNSDLLQVVDMLDRLYGEFDQALRRHKMCCVDIIGDAYMSCSGLHGADPLTQATRATQWCVDAVRAANSLLACPRLPELGRLSIRAGIHAGPCTGTVIGRTRARFSIFGDTVNVAARMESLSRDDCIHLSSQVAHVLLGPGADVELARGLRLRGKILVKGKGTMETFFLLFNGCKDPFSLRDHSTEGK